MSHHPIPRNVIESLFASNSLLPRLANSYRLYLHLVCLATPWGLIIRSRKRLADDLTVSEQTIDRWVKRLADARLVYVQVPSPFLVIRLRFWSSSTSTGAEKPANSAADASDKEENAPGKQLAAAALSSGVGGLGEGAGLGDEIREVLGEAGAAEVAGLVNAYPPHVVRKALQRVRTTPQHQIRKSKAALFRYLLAVFTD
jgi:hypothetical protein